MSETLRRLLSFRARLYLSVVDAVGLHHVEERLLAEPVLLLEEGVLGVRPGDVPPDHLQGDSCRGAKTT